MQNSQTSSSKSLEMILGNVCMYSNQSQENCGQIIICENQCWQLASPRPCKDMHRRDELWHSIRRKTIFFCQSGSANHLPSLVLFFYGQLMEQLPTLWAKILPIFEVLNYHFLLLMPAEWVSSKNVQIEKLSSKTYVQALRPWLQQSSVVKQSSVINFFQVLLKSYET